MLRIGSRGSQLALWQANHIAASLGALGHETAIEIIRTTGDRMQTQPAAGAGADGKGIFTKEIEEALAEDRIDLAVHSLKDLPTEIDARFVLAAIPARADARDVFVSARYGSLEALPAGAAIGTGSLRRQAQLRALRPDLTPVEFRGNVDTRLRKVEEGQAAAIVLAAAGLDRLKKTQWIRYRFSPEEMCPAPGQGALAIECRAGDGAIRAALAPLDDVETRLAVTAERAFLAALGGGCQTPVGAFGEREGGELRLRGIVASPDGARILRGSLLSEAMDEAAAANLGRQLARTLIGQGAGAILALEGDRA